MRWPMAVAFLEAHQSARREHLYELSLAVRAGGADQKGFEAWQKAMQG